MKTLNTAKRYFTKRTFLTMFTLFFVSVFFYACEDDDSVEIETEPTPVEVRMTDAPGDFQEVNIDLQQIRVQTANGGWVNLNTVAGVYNLLDFSNGIDTVIAIDSISSSRINQIRFVLGSNNSIVIDGQSYFLKVPSGEQSGLKLLVNETLTPGIKYSMLIDFDVARSVVVKGNGDYSLKPVLKLITEGQNAILKGKVLPASPYVKLFAMQGADTLGGAITDSTGAFSIGGLLQGNYDLHINPPSPYVKDTIENISLVNGSVTDLGEVYLSQ